MSERQTLQLTGPSGGTYRTIAALAHGGMADVFLARMKGASDFTKLAVLKRMQMSLEGDDDMVSMFLDEARLAARLNHPNVVQTFEVGQDERGHFLVMEFLDGQSLANIIRRGKRAESPLPLSHHVHVLTEVCAGLHYAHELLDFNGTPLNVVHRDVSPQNVFVLYTGQTKLVDFGVAKSANARVATATGVLKGKVGYMAPEQARGAAGVDRRADLFSVGVMLWEALTGGRFWGGASDLEIMAHLVHEAPFPAPTGPQAQAHPALVRVCQKAIATDRDDRYATAAELQVAIEEASAQDGLHTSARQIGQHVAEAFREERQRLRETVEKHSADTSSMEELPRLALAGRSGGTPTPATGDGRGQDGDALTPSGPLPSTLTAASSPSRTTAGMALGPAAAELPVETSGTARPRSWAWVGGVAAAAVAVGLLAWGLRASPDHAPGAAASASSVAPPASTLTAASSVVGTTTGPAVATSVQLRVVARPPETKIYLDDLFLGDGSVDRPLRAEATPRTLRLEAQGYLPRTVKVLLDRDQSFELSLAPRPRDAAGRPPARATGEPAVPAATPTGIRELDAKPTSSPPPASIDTSVFK